MNLLQVKKLHKDAIIPSYAHPGEDAAFDLHCLSEFILKPNDGVSCVSTGIATEFAPGLYAQILGRSGLASKGVIILGGVIDSGYRGEWCVFMANIGKEPISFKAGAKIAQCVIKVVPQVIIKESETLTDSRRGANGFGSTDPNRPYKALHTA